MIQLNYEDEGDGLPLIVMHGLFGSATNWKRVAKGLVERFRVISVDLRNHGNSGWDDDVSYPAMAADITGLMDHLDLEKSFLLGHSMGGKVAMTTALAEADRVEGIVVVDIAPVAYGHSHETLIEVLLGVDLGRIRNRRDLDDQLKGDIPEASLRQFLGQNLVRRDGQYAWRINLKALAKGMSSLTGFPDPGDARYEGPAIFVHGERSDYVLPSHRDTIRRLFPASRLIGIEGAGHWLHAEQPDRLIQIVNDFVS